MSTNEEIITEIKQGAAIEEGTMALVKVSGENSRDHGFHDDWPVGTWNDKRLADQRRAIAEKLALIHEEISEALGEIRSGRAPLEVYYVDHKGLVGEKGAEYDHQIYGTIEGSGGVGVPMLKPEGFIVELADSIIRTADLAYLVGDLDGTHLAQALAIKGKYNTTRPYKHGRKF